jgi:glycosyltransferase involved in cell wall biosynthesis
MKNNKPSKLDESLSIIIPAYNEEGTIIKVTKQALSDAKKFTRNFEIIIVDDGSSDETGTIANLLAKTNKHIRVIHHKKNQGLDKAFWTGIKTCKNDIITYIPADGQAPLGDQEKLLEKIKKADIVLGSRSSRSDYSLYRKILSYGYLILLRLLFNLKFQDVNWVHVYRRKVFEVIEIKSQSPFFLSELIIKAARHGLKIDEAPSIYHPREIGFTKVAKLSVVFKVFKDLMKLRLGLLD